VFATLLHKGSVGILLTGTVQQFRMATTILSTKRIRSNCLTYWPNTHLSLSSSSSRQSAKSFDFSSPAGWESYYRRKELLSDLDVQEGPEHDEWHSSLPLETVASLIPNDADCLCVGCGTSRLPSAILHRRRRERQKQQVENRIVLFDSSPSCLRLLEKTYKSDVEYVCGDATKLSTYFCPTVTSEVSEEQMNCSTFDIIVDKGLTDAILCSEGFDGPLCQLMIESSKVLKQGGRYLLISYSMPASSQDFIRELGRTVGLEWEFDVDIGSTVGASTQPILATDGFPPKKTGYPKVCVSWATRR
jgi:hypothetical protein